MSVASKVSDDDLKIIIKEMMIETLQEFSLREIVDDEQTELETMFGSTPHFDESECERELEL